MRCLWETWPIRDVKMYREGLAAAHAQDVNLITMSYFKYTQNKTAAMSF